MQVFDIGVKGYEETLKIQLDLLNKRINKAAEDTVIFVEHLPVVTMGRLSEENSLLNRSYFETRGIRIIRAGRGGKITYHAPGQLVAYPVLDLTAKNKDIGGYINVLEKTVENMLNVLCVPAVRIEGKRGVWVSGKKIAFTGVAFKRWVTYHGVSVNVNNDIEPFGMMAPCGEPGIMVTSAKKETGRELQMATVKKIFMEEFLKCVETL